MVAASRRVIPEGFEKEIGRRVRVERIMQGIGQSQLAEMIGVTYQQAHKYETGINRISASRAAAIASALNVPLDEIIPPVQIDVFQDAATLTSRRLMIEISKEMSRVPIDVQRRASIMVRALADTYCEGAPESD